MCLRSSTQGFGGSEKFEAFKAGVFLNERGAEQWKGHLKWEGRAGGRRRRVSEAAESQRDALAPKALSVGGRGNFCCAQSQLVPCQCGRPDVWAEDPRKEAKGAGDVGGIRILKVTRDQGTEGGTRQSGLFSNTGTGRPREGGSPRSHTPVSAGWLCAVSCCPPQGEGGREKGGADFKVQGPSAFECRGGNRP